MERKVTILIVEDELIVADYMQDCLERLDYSIVGVAINYEEAVTLLEQQKPDLVLLDISLKGQRTGIDLGKYISAHYDIPFIFTSSHSDRDTIDKAKATLPYSYLIKPFNEEDLYAVIETALIQFSRREKKQAEQPDAEPVIIDNAIFIKNKNRFVKVKLDELLYLEANDNYATLFTGQSSYVLKTTLKTLQDALPEFFWRIHRSFVINLHQMKSFSPDEVILSDGRTLPIGRSFYPLLLKKLNIVQG